MAWLRRAAARRGGALVRLPLFSGRIAVLAPMGILVAGLSRHNAKPCVVLHRTQTPAARAAPAALAQHLFRHGRSVALRDGADAHRLLRSEERRVGKECRCGW